MPHGLWISQKKKNSFSPSWCLNFKSTFASGNFFYFFTLTASRSRPLCSALCFSASLGSDSFLLILILITWFSFFLLIIFSVFLFYLFIYFSNFISDSPFMLVVEHLVHMMILISIFSMTNESCVIKWTFKLRSCLFETLKLICYLDVMNLFAICHLDLNVMTDW